MPPYIIRYILGATGESRQQRRLHPRAQLCYIDYVFIENDEDVRAWLLSNPVLDDPFDLLVYCHHPETQGRLPTLPLRGHNYLRENAIANWASTAAPGNRIQGARSDARTDPGPSNAGGEQEQRDDSPLVFVTGRGGAGFHFVTPPLLRPGVNSSPFLPAPYDTGPWPGCGAGRVFYFPR